MPASTLGPGITTGEPALQRTGTANSRVGFAVPPRPAGESSSGSESSGTESDDGDTKRLRNGAPSGSGVTAADVTKSTGVASPSGEEVFPAKNRAKGSHK